VHSWCSTIVYDITTIVDEYQSLEECTVSILMVNVSQVGKVTGYVEVGEGGGMSCGR
jgi:hypothetical protein